MGLRIPVPSKCHTKIPATLQEYVGVPLLQKGCETQNWEGPINDTYLIFFTFTHGKQASFIKALMNEKVEIYVTWRIAFSSLKRVHLFLTCKQSIKNYKHSFGETGSEQALHCSPPYWRAQQDLTRTLPEMCQTLWTPVSPMIREAWYHVGLSWRPNTWLWSGALCSLLLAWAGSCLSDSGCPHAHQRHCQDPDLPWRSPCCLQEMPRNNTALQKGGTFRLFILTFQSSGIAGLSVTVS